MLHICFVVVVFVIGGVFGAIFFVVMWVNLIACDRLASTELGAVQKDEIVRRYQQIVRPYAGRLYIALALIMAVLDGAIANVALPTIAAHLRTTPEASISIINAYQLAVTVLLLPLSSLGEILATSAFTRPGWWFSPLPRWPARCRIRCWR